MKNQKEVPAIPIPVTPVSKPEILPNPEQPDRPHEPEVVPEPKPEINPANVNNSKNE